MPSSRASEYPPLEKLFSWKIRSKLNEGVVIEFMRIETGYRVSIDILKSCYGLPASSLFNRSDWLLFEAERIGPDEIIVQLEGASLQTVVARSENFCNQYYAIFQIPQKGKYRLKINRIRTNYEAVKLIPRFPIMDLDVFLDQALPFDLLPGKSARCSAGSRDGYWLSFGQNQISRTPLSMNVACAGVAEARGLPTVTTFIKVSDSVGTMTSKINCSNDVNTYHWKKNKCFTPDYYRTFNDSSEGMNHTIVDVSGNGLTDLTNDHRDFVNKSILFVGDSHMRGLAELFMVNECESYL